MKENKVALIEIGKSAPDFRLKDQAGKEHTLKDYADKTLILYFYPRDMTPGCTTEACEFNENIGLLRRKKTVVLGVSADSEERHAKFSEKYQLSFPLLADVETKICQKYGVWQEKKLYGKSSMGIVRTTYIISGKGKVLERYDKVRVKGHVDKVIEDL